MKSLTKISTIATLLFCFSFLPCKSQNPPTNVTNASRILQKYSTNKDLVLMLKEVDFIRKEAVMEIQQSAQNNQNALELISTICLLDKFPEVKGKAERELVKLQNECYATGLDALEQFEMANDMQYKTYNNILSNIQTQQDTRSIIQAKSLFVEATKIYEHAKRKRNAMYSRFEEKESITELIEAQKLEELAINKQEIAFSLFLGFDYSEEETWVAKVEKCYNKNPIQTVIPSENIILAEQTNDATPILKDKSQIKIRELEDLYIGRITYKVQVGAFIGKVCDTAFKGIQPITIEKTSNGYTKYLIGEYNTMDVARHAQKIIVETGFNDAFVVAYDYGKRIGVVENTNQENLAEK